MTQICSICNHPKRALIDQALVKGQAIATISQKFNCSRYALTNHSEKHLSRQLLKAWSIKDGIEGMNILAEIQTLIDRTKTILDKAEERNKYGTALLAIREVRNSYELLSKIAFSLNQARLSELEMLRLQKDDEETVKTHDYSKQLQILSMNELNIFIKIIRKITKQDISIDCLGMRGRHTDKNNDIFDNWLNPYIYPTNENNCEEPKEIPHDFDFKPEPIFRMKVKRIEAPEIPVYKRTRN